MGVCESMRALLRECFARGKSLLCTEGNRRRNFFDYSLLYRGLKRIIKSPKDNINFKKI